MKTLTFIAFLLLTTFISCDKGPNGYEYNEGHLPTEPVNLTGFNSAHDDYNSTAPTLGQLIPFCFSTNRMSGGETFDIIYKPMSVNFDKTTGILKVSNTYDIWLSLAEEYQVLNSALFKVNSDGNEFGPYLLHQRNSGFSDIDFLLLYATDESGNFQINYTYNDPDSSFSEKHAVHFMNTEFDDLYPSFNDDFSSIYFCSNRENNQFDIYSVDIDVNSDKIIKVLSDTNMHTVTKNTVLSSEFNDKCPYIFENMLVFTSNRPGGFGGYDLYFSILENGIWSMPQNFGATINTEFDEYRPIVFEEGVDSKRHMMVFSSNREGGMGGFDLYFVGVDKVE